MRSTDLLLNLSRQVLCLCVDRDLRAQLFRERDLFRSQIHGCYMQSHSFRVLNGNVTQSSNARDYNPLSRSRLSLFEALIRGDASTQDRRCIYERKTAGDSSEIVSLR